MPQAIVSPSPSPSVQSLRTAHRAPRAPRLQHRLQPACALTSQEKIDRLRPELRKTRSEATVYALARPAAQAIAAMGLGSLALQDGNLAWSVAQSTQAAFSHADPLQQGLRTAIAVKGGLFVGFTGILLPWLLFQNRTRVFNLATNVTQGAAQTAQRLHRRADHIETRLRQLQSQDL
jgi:hypothetical protein